MSSFANPEAAGPRRHDDFYFNDGNLVLVAEDVFRGMMSIPQPIDAMTIDGCPIVTLYDTAAEVAYLLVALYDGLYFTEGTMIDFPALSAVLRLSTKYFFSCLRQRALARLRLDWPLTLADWDAREKSATTPDGLYNPSTTRTNPILIVNLARTLHLPSLLPAALYDLSRYTPTQILGGSPDMPDCPKEWLHKADLMLVFRGKEAGTRFMTAFIAKELENRGAAPWCRNGHDHEGYNSICRDAFGMIAYETLRGVSGLTVSRESDPLFTLQCVGEMQIREKGLDFAEKVTSRGCEMCRADLRKATERARQDVWDSIPQWFGLGTTAVEDDV